MYTFKKCMPARFKELHYYNVGPIAESVFELFKPFMTKKQKERVGITFQFRCRGFETSMGLMYYIECFMTDEDAWQQHGRDL